MKKIFLVLIAFAGMVIASNAQLAIAPELGLNIADMSMKQTNLAGGSYSYSTSGKPGAGFGAIVDVGITGNIYFQPGLFYEMTGAKFTANSNFPGGRWDINTLEIPLNFEYKTGEEGGNRFFVGIGPYIGYNISGNYSYDADAHLNTIAASGNLKIGSSASSGDYVRALDLGLGINVGYLLANGFYLRVHYQNGFTNLDPYADANDVYKTSALGITIGYYFGTHHSKKNKGTGDQ